MPNAGSLAIYIFTGGVGILLLVIMRCFVRVDSKIYIYLDTKLRAFKWAGFTDFINEIYLPMSYIVSINSSSMGVETMSQLLMSVLTAMMSLVLICWPFYISINVYILLATRPEYQITLQSGIEILEGGEPEEETKSQS